MAEMYDLYRQLEKTVLLTEEGSWEEVLRLNLSCRESLAKNIGKISEALKRQYESCLDACIWVATQKYQKEHALQDAKERFTQIQPPKEL